MKEPALSREPPERSTGAVVAASGRIATRAGHEAVARNHDGGGKPMSLSTTSLAVEVLRPGDDGYDAAARSFFAKGEPALVVRPSAPTPAGW